MQLTALKERLLDAFKRQAEARRLLVEQERVYIEAIKVGLMEPIEPPIKQRWRLAGLNLNSDISGGYTNEVRFNRPFRYRGSFEPKLD